MVVDAPFCTWWAYSGAARQRLARKSPKAVKTRVRVDRVIPDWVIPDKVRRIRFSVQRCVGRGLLAKGSIGGMEGRGDERRCPGGASGLRETRKSPCRSR